MDSYEFLSHLYGEDAPGSLVIWTGHDKKSRWFKASDLNKAIAAVNKMERVNTYFGVGLQNQAAALARAAEKAKKKVVASGTRGFMDTAIAIPGLWIDIDVQGPGHSAENLPATMDAAMSFVQSFPLQPTMLVATGGGLHGYWLFKELWEFDDDEERQFAQALSRRFQFTLQAIAKEAHQWDIDSTYDLARVLRLPGTYNVKNDPVLVEVVRFDDLCRYNPDDFEPYLRELPDEPDRPRRTVDPATILAGIPEGNRDNSIFKYAASLRARGVDKSEAEILVLQAAASCTPPFSREAALEKLESAWRYPAGENKEQEIQQATESARISVQDVTPDNAYNPEVIGNLAILKDNDPAEYAKVKQGLKGKINLNDLERAVNKQLANNRKLHIVEPNEPMPLLEEVLPDIPMKELRRPHAWTLNENGIWQDTKNGPICACSVPVILTERLKNIESGTERMKLSFFRDRKWHNVISDRSTIFNHSSVVQLADKGLPVASTNSKDLVRYLVELERENMNNFPIKKAIQHMGWCGKDTFFPGAENNIILDLDDNSNSVASHYHPSGTAEQWAEIVAPLRKHPVGRFILAAGFASPLMELIGQRVFVIHTWGPSRGGKTAAMKAALSIWGNPDGIMTSFNATKVALEKVASLYCDLPLGIDERQIVGGKQDQIESIIYTLSMGKGKARGTKQGGLQRFTTWRSIIMMNGEHPITTASTSTGVKTRSLEIYGTVIDDEEYAGQLHRKLNLCYGSAGPLFISKVIESIADKNTLFMFQEDYETVYQELKKRHPDNAASHLGYVTTVLMGDFYSSLWLFGMDEEAAIQETFDLGDAILDRVESTSEMDEATRAYEYFMSWYNVNALHFGSSPPSGKRYGLGESEGYLWVYPTVFSEAMKEGHFNPDRIKRDWAEKDNIKVEVRGKQRRFECRKYDAEFKNRVYFVAVKLRSILDD